MKTKDRMSTGETVATQTVHHQENEDKESIVLQVISTSWQRQLSTGIGVVAETFSHTRIAEWALKERSLGTKLLDDAAAVKLVLCKALEQNWDKINILLQNKELLR